jgi:hypothetical protein
MTAAGGGSAAIEVMRALPKAAENVPHTGDETDSAEDEKENGLGVKPAVEKETEAPTDYDSGNEDEGQLHGNGSLVGDVFRFLL